MSTILAREVSLNSTLVHGRYAVPNQNVIFTCMTKNATVLSWNSSEYIGLGNEFHIASAGEARNRTRGTTVATRVHTYNDNGITVIVSQLHIIALEEISTSSVTCRINGEGPSETVHFITTGMSAIIIIFFFKYTKLLPPNVIFTSTIISKLYAIC